MTLHNDMRIYRAIAPVLLIVAGLLAVPATSHAQGVGVVGGLNFTSMDDVDYGDTRATFESRSGYHVGLYLDIPLGPVGVRPAVRYLKAGPIYEGIGEAVRGNDDVDGPGGDMPLQVRDDFDVSFLAFPVDAVLRLPLPIINPYGFVGPEFRLQRAPDAPDEIGDELNDWSYIGNLGVGAEISLPGFGVTLTPEIRYSFGLSDLIDRDVGFGGQTFTATDQRRSESFFISLGIQP